MAKPSGGSPRADGMSASCRGDVSVGERAADHPKSITLPATHPQTEPESASERVERLECSGPFGRHRNLALSLGLGLGVPTYRAMN